MWYMLKEIQRKQDKQERQIEDMRKEAAAREIKRLESDLANARGIPLPAVTTTVRSEE